MSLSMRPLAMVRAQTRPFSRMYRTRLEAVPKRVGLKPGAGSLGAHVRTQTRWQSGNSSKGPETEGPKSEGPKTERPAGFFRRVAARPYFYYELAVAAALLGGFYYTNLEVVPVSERRRFNIISPEREKQQALLEYEEIKRAYGRRIMPHNSKYYQTAKRVMDRLAPHAPVEGQHWEVTVVADPTRNAFVLPGGKVFLYAGMMDFCDTEDGLAAVLSHEMGHNVAHHMAERQSRMILVFPFGILAWLTTGIDPWILNQANHLMLYLPVSRRQEAEADQIGLTIMTKACYDPQGAVEQWQKMASTGKKFQPEFLSTHPSDDKRVKNIQSQMGDVQQIWDDNGCAGTRQYNDDFRSAAFSRGQTE